MGGDENPCPPASGRVELTWKTVHGIRKRYGFMIWVVRTLVPYKRFQRRLVDSLGQAPVYRSRVAEVRGHLSGHTVLEDRLRYPLMARAYR